MNFKLPYQIFPGIFSSIDSYTKKITWSYYEKHKKLPPWFDKVGKCKGLFPVPHWSKFYLINEEFNIKLTGAPDDIFIRFDRKYFVVDYKTAKFTDNQNSLLPLYKVQLNGYAYIFEKLGIGKIAGLGLIYYEPCNGIEKIDDVVSKDGFSLPFKAHVEKIELNPEKIVLPLLQQVRKYADMKAAPQGRDGCEDCGKLDELIKIVL